VLSSVVAVTLVRKIAIAILRPDAHFLPLMSPFPMTDTAIFASAAVLVFVKFGRYNAEPIPEYRRLAAWVLVVSFVPDIALALLHGFGGGWPEACALMVMHVVVWAICVTLLPALVAARRDDTESKRY
jgi:hypothetical protein